LEKGLSGVGELELLVASPEANSFYNSGKVKEKIPLFYRKKTLEYLG
jgi:hypothetical protein